MLDVSGNRFGRSQFSAQSTARLPKTTLGFVSHRDIFDDWRHIRGPNLLETLDQARPPETRTLHPMRRRNRNGRGYLPKVRQGTTTRQSHAAIRVSSLTGSRAWRRQNHAEVNSGARIKVDEKPAKKKTIAMRRPLFITLWIILACGAWLTLAIGSLKIMERFYPSLYASILKAIPFLILLPCVLVVGPLIAMSVVGHLALNAKLPGTHKYPPATPKPSAFPVVQTPRPRNAG
jgi:hypothetical protein